ncbi:hypothetical protein [Haloarchaeobius sp. DFWS5]|uniref:hypothetical protein n=1 Tax=Haloarchaeobius sp. DFWS5 TaxID=3446114 RepID=UPI003EBB0094
MQETVKEQGTQFDSIVNKIRRPEYTGDNRCLPCTATNLVIGAGLTAGAYVVSPLAAVPVAAGSLAMIYFRGYLVPGTPELTKRYFPEWLLKKFDKGTKEFDPTGFDVETALVEAGALEEDSTGLDLQLTPAFAAAWEHRMAELADREADVDELATILDVDADRLAITEQDGDAFVAWLDGDWLGQWESRAAFVADIAGAKELETRYDGWDVLPMLVRSELLGGLRLFIERCPTCSGQVAFGQQVVSSCCRSYDVVASSCQNCGSRLFESEVDLDAFAEATA